MPGVVRLASVVLILSMTFFGVPTAGADGTCTPAHDATATSIADEFYLRLRDTGSGKYLEWWQETNDVPGLQYSSGMGCGADPDHMIISQCINTICLDLPLA